MSSSAMPSAYYDEVHRPRSQARPRPRSPLNLGEQQSRNHNQSSVKQRSKKHTTRLPIQSKTAQNHGSSSSQLQIEPVNPSHKTNNIHSTPGVTKPSSPLLAFPLFPNLPSELRIKIWAFASHQPRFLELEWVEISTANIDTHEHYHLCARSRLPPSILQATSESRYEALRYYRIVDFTRDLTDPAIAGTIGLLLLQRIGPQQAYFNHVSDIVYFGEGATCMTTMKNFLRDQEVRGIPIENVAIAVSEKVMDCHAWQWIHPTDGPLFSPYNRLCCVLGNGQTLNRAFRNEKYEMPVFDLALGTHTLQNVFLVVPSSLPNLKRGDIDESIGYRAACTDGLTQAQINLKKHLQADLQLVASHGKRLQEGEILGLANDNLPRGFKFISLSPTPALCKKLDAMKVENYELRKLKIDNFLQMLEMGLGVHIKVPKEMHEGQKMQEIGFYGEPEAVAHAMQAVHWRLNHWAKTPMPMEAPELRNQGYTGSKALLDVPVSHYYTGVSASLKY